jgi:hypothetical protein
MEAGVGIGQLTPRFEADFNEFGPVFNSYLVMQAYAAICICWQICWHTPRPEPHLTLTRAASECAYVRKDSKQFPPREPRGRFGNSALKRHRRSGGSSPSRRRRHRWVKFTWIYQRTSERRTPRGDSADSADPKRHSKVGNLRWVPSQSSPCCPPVVPSRQPARCAPSGIGLLRGERSGAVAVLLDHRWL